MKMLRHLSQKKFRKKILWTIIVCGSLCIFIICSIVGTGVGKAIEQHRMNKQIRSIPQVARDAISKLEEEGLTTKGFYKVTINGVTSINGVIIANKSYSLPKSYGDGLTEATETAFNEMKNAAAEDGIKLEIVSGFRSYNTQKDLYNSYVNRYGQEKAETFSARAGYSEHQIGEAVDLNDVHQAFANTDAYAWLQKHAVEYGFILRYPQDATDKTGYIGEPWHYRYVGKELAQAVYNEGNWITLEEYFGIDSEYED